MSRLIFDADTLGGTTTLSSADAVGNFTITVPAVDGTMSVKDASGDATFRNLTLTGAVLAGAWNGTTIAVAYGGTGATTLTGYVKGNGTSAMTASTTIPNTDITGLGTMSTQNANAVVITGGTIAGLSAAIPVGSGGTGATTLTGYVKGNGTSLMTASATIPSTDITGLGTMSVQNATAVTITGGTANNLVIGGTTAAAATVTTLRINSTLSLAGTTGTSGQVLTSNGASAPTWQNIAGSGTVTSIDVSGGTTGLTTSGGPVTGSGTITLAGTLAAVNGGTGQSSYVIGNLLYASTTTALSKLAIGTTGQVLTVTAGIPAWATPTTGTVTSVAGTGTVNGLTLTGTVTSSGSLTLGGTLDLSSPPAIGGTAAAAGSFTTLTASTSLIVKDTVFTLQDDADPTKQALFQLSGLTASASTIFTLPIGVSQASTLIDSQTAQTISGSKTFTANTLFSAANGSYGTGITTGTQNYASGATTTGLTKTVNFGTGGLSGSTTAITIGSNVSGATSTTTMNGITNFLDTGFTLQDDADPTKQAQFQLSGLLTAQTTVYTLPVGFAAASLLLDAPSTQTINGIKTFSSATINVGSSVLASTQQFAYGAITTGLTKTVNIGTGGLSGSTTNITVGGTAGTSTTTMNGTSLFAGTGYAANFALTDAATVAWDTTNQTATFTFVSSNRTFGAPTNLKNGAFYALAVIQNAGSNTLTWNAVFKWTGGVAPTLSTAASARDYFVFRSDGTNLYEQGRSLGVA